MYFQLNKKRLLFIMFIFSFRWDIVYFIWDLIIVYVFYSVIRTIYEDLGLPHLVRSLKVFIDVVKVFLSSDVDTPPGLSKGIVGLLLSLQVAQVGSWRKVLIDAPHQILHQNTNKVIIVVLYFIRISNKVDIETNPNGTYMVKEISIKTLTIYHVQNLSTLVPKLISKHAWLQSGRLDCSVRWSKWVPSH